MIEKIFGWITPKRQFIDAGQWGHYKTIEKENELKDLVPNYENKKKRLNSILKNCKAKCNDDEHPSWHIYELAKGDYIEDTINALYNAGCLRVGTSYNILHIEGTADAIKNLYQFCKDFAEDQGMAYKFELRSI